MRIFKIKRLGTILGFTLVCVVPTVNALTGRPISESRQATQTAAADTAITASEADTTAAYAPVALPTAFANTSANGINRSEKLYPVFEKLRRSGRPLRVMQIGDSHVAGKDFPLAIRTTLESVWGVAENDSADSGLHYQYMAKNGATTNFYATEEKIALVEEAAPDLIILSFGTNECHSLKYDTSVHATALATFLAMLKTACPSAVIMLTTPPGDYLTTRTVRYIRSARARRKGWRARKVVHSTSRMNPMTSKCAAELERFGAANGLPVWDMNTIVGGDKAPANWSEAGLMRPDKVHYTPEGYTLQGHMLADAILAAYNEYLDKTRR